jgi:FAD/FMN-containing dehydrogenase
VLTGEHGVGVEKRDLMGEMFNETDLNQQIRVKCAFDPDHLLIRARSSRSCIAAPSWAGCTSTRARSHSPICRGFERTSVNSSLRPDSAQAVQDVVAWAAAKGVPLEILGHGSRRGVGRPVQPEHTLDLSGLSGVTLYEPEELVLSAKAGTPLAEIELLLANHNQALAFEPMDCGPLYGLAPGRGTIGGVLASNACGPRRIKAGAARDHVLGIHAVSGRGETFKSGGRVVKNVTGYDLSKGPGRVLGTLAVVTDVTFKVLPRPEHEATLVISGLHDAAAVAALCEAMGTPWEVSGAAHVPEISRRLFPICPLGEGEPR